MKTNDKGIALIKSFESCKLSAYLISGEKYYTIGYGHSYDSSITANTTITQAQADAYLKSDLAKFEKYVTSIALAKFPNLTENQFSALVSYTYNRGQGGLKQLISNSSSVSELGTNIVVYWGSATKYKNGLVRRRKAEQTLFRSDSVGTLTIPNCTLKLKASGSTVKSLQTCLNALFGTNLKVDGAFGKATYSALVVAQTNLSGMGYYSSKIDGVYGTNTRNALVKLAESKGYTVS